VSWLGLVLNYTPAAIRDAAWVARFLKWREEKRRKGELDSQKEMK